MNKELYVSSTPHETKVAMTEDDQLAEVFFERENEYTLAGSIYKGRVTRVLPGMQSAFVDIGLERDAFLYVSDFLELGDDEEDEEFGSIPAPKGAIDAGRQQANTAQQSAPSNGADVMEPEADAQEGTAPVDDFEPQNGSEEETEENDNGENDQQAGDETSGTRRWRGRRRRRGGRRGRADGQNSNRSDNGEASRQAVEEPEKEAVPEPESRERNDARRERSDSRRERNEGRRERTEDAGPPPGYAPIILPGESISKYRHLAERTNPYQDESGPSATSGSDAEAAVKDFSHSTTEREHAEAYVPRQRENPQTRQGHVATEPEQLEWAAAGLHQAHTHEASEEAEISASTAQEHEGTVEDFAQESEEVTARKGSSSVSDLNVEEQEEQVEYAGEALQESASSASFRSDEAGEAGEDELVESIETAGENGFVPPDEYSAEERAGQPTDQSLESAASSHWEAPRYRENAPLVAPQGRTLEHETLDDDESEYPPVPENIEAISEVAADEETVLEEETLDADSYNDRWVPKIADVDEDEVVAAEERGESIYAGEGEEDENGEGEPVNGHAEVRAASPTAGYQQRQFERRGYDRYQRGRGRRNNVRLRSHGHRPQPLITDLLKEGQEVLIQIAKEPIGKKGARITSHIALPGRFLVYMPTVNHVGVSRKINSEEERQRLKRIVTSERENGQGGFIVRTAAAHIKEDDLRADIRFLKHLWAEIKTRSENSKSPALIYHDLNLVERVLRDQVNADFSQIWVDTEDEYERVVRFANRFQPSLVRRIKLYTKDTPLFEHFGIQTEIDRSLKSKVWLKSGGYIVINQTEALVAIDINTGKYVGKTQRLEDTIVKTNVDAIKEIVRQIRLRDLGGIIVIDFIDMDERKNRQKVMQALEEALRNDRAPSKVLQFNDFGLVAITRKRVKQSLERTLGEPCPYCVGAGFVKSVSTVCNELYIEMRKMVKEHDRTDITLRVNPEVAKALKANNGKLVMELEELTGKTVLVKGDPLLHQENFDIQ